jgi:hypothetical protein
MSGRTIRRRSLVPNCFDRHPALCVCVLGFLALVMAWIDNG